MKNYEDLALTYIDRDWPDIHKQILENVEDWKICVQAGGHFGLYPSRLAEMFDEVHTFEADPNNFEKLIDTCSNLNNVHCYNKALSSYDRTMDIVRIDGGNSGQNMVFPGTQIQAVTIDSLNLSSCGLIQLDIERHELFALMGAIKTIEKFRPVIILEAPETTNNACNVILEQLGYEHVGRAGVDSVFKFTNRFAPTTEYKTSVKKKILIAIPTARYIEADTFKSIYNLEIPEGYETTFQYFYGYRVDQVRNLIANWVVNGFDYLFAVDHDVTFAPDTLKKMLAHDVDVVSGIYRQRVPEQLIEIYDLNQHRMKIDDLVGKPLVKIGGCGFGCVLVKKEVLVRVGYPQFEYHPALNHNNTISEDNDFCKKVTRAGFSIWCDPSILCGHIGMTTMHVEVNHNPVLQRLRDLSLRDDLPKQHVDYLRGMSHNGVTPKVIYDIGACVMHWTKEARKIWPDSKIIMFDAMNHAEPLYKESGLDYYCDGPIGDFTRWVKFYEKPMDPAGNSIFKENTPFYTEEHAVDKKMRSLDDIVSENDWPLPDLIKIDVQGAELHVLVGAENTLKNCKDIIIEMQHEDYNLGAPKVDEVTQYLNEIGFKLVSKVHDAQVDADYHFTRVAS